MKKIFAFICVAALALSFACDASAQEVSAKRKTYRQTVTYASLGAMANLSATDFGVGVAVGFRNYNREAIVSFAPSIEAFADYFPVDIKIVSDLMVTEAKLSNTHKNDPLPFNTFRSGGLFK